MSKKLRVTSLLLALTMSVGLFAGCGKGTAEGKPGAAGTTGTVKDSIVIATTSETPSVHPADHNATAGSYINALTYSTLFTTDVELNPIPLLVDTYENVSPTEWTFKIKEGVKFHDGSVMTAEDVAASIMWEKGFSQISLYNDCIASVEAIDGLTVKITTTEPSAVLLSYLGHHGNSIVPKALIDSGNDFGKNPIGSGPYVFKDWTLGDSLTFEAFADYFEGAPAIKTMTWKTIPEGSSRTIALEAGEVDYVVEVEAMDTQRLKDNADLAVYEFDSTEVNWLMLNNDRPNLDNADVRHAINSAIDKQSVIEVALNGMGTPAISQTPGNLAGGNAEGGDAYDVEKAKEYLTKSGVNPADIKFSIICSNDTKKRAAEVIQANLLEVGINCEIESMDLATYLTATADGDYTAAIGGYTAGTMVSYMVGVMHSKSIGASNKSRLSSPEVDALIDKAAATIDDAERETILKECSKLLNELCPQAPLYQGKVARAGNANLEGVIVTNSGDMRWEKVKWKA